MIDSKSRMNNCQAFCDANIILLDTSNKKNKNKTIGDGESNSQYEHSARK